MKGRFGRLIPLIMVLGDFVLVNMLFYFASLSFPIFFKYASFRLLWLMFNICFVPVAFFQFRVGFNIRSITFDKILMDSFRAVFMHAVLYMAINAFLKTYISAWFYAELYGMMLVALPLWWILDRRAVKYLRKHGRNYVNVVIIGCNRTGQRLAEEMRKEPGYGIRILGFFDDTEPDELSEKYIGKINILDDFVRTNNIKEIYYALAGKNDDTLKRVIKVADDNVIPFYYVPQISRYLSRNFALHNLGSMPVLTILRNPLKNTFNAFIKRSFDIAFSSVVLVFSPIVFIPVAIGIKLSSPGPVFFVQDRTGYKGKSFRCLKFRTMRVNAGADRVQATQDDPRKTRFGDFLRRTSIDELPQFINVWRGDMSVVGPRPHMLKHTEDYTRIIDKYMVRHTVRPGITGWAQVNGYRGITDQLWKMEKRVECDVWYIEHWNFFLDLKIIIRTVVNAFVGEKNAF